MLTTILKIVLVLLLIAIVIQDIKYRAIHVFLPIITGVISLFVFIRKGRVFSELLMSLSFVMITFFGLWLYIIVKNRKLMNPLNSFIGVGDILFFIMIIPLFSFINYIYFYITGLLFSAVVHGLVSKEKSIPLAGYLSVFLIFLIVIEFITQKNIFFHN